MYFYFIVVLAILLPIISKNKKRGLRLAMLLLFVLLGFQYELVQDWVPNIGRWYYANKGASENATATALKMGSVFLWLMKVLEPISFFGWLMLTAAVFLLLIYKFIRLYVPPKYYWLALFIFMMNVEYAPLMINSNRQCISMIFVLIGVLFLIKGFKLRYRLPFVPDHLAVYVIPCVCFVVGAQCHSVAYISFLLIPLYTFSKWYSGNNWLLLAILLNLIFIARTFSEVLWLQNYALAFSVAADMGDADVYIETFADGVGETSSTYTFIYSIVIFGVCYLYRQLDPINRFFAVSWVFGFMIASYFTGNINRLGEYFYIYFLFLMPNAFDIMFKQKGVIAAFASFFFCVYLAYGVGHSWKQMHGEYYERWLNYKSVFDAPRWE